MKLSFLFCLSAGAFCERAQCGVCFFAVTKGSFFYRIGADRAPRAPLARVFIFPLFLLCLSVCVSILAFLIPV